MRLRSFFFVLLSALFTVPASAGYLGIAHFQNGNNDNSSSPYEVEAENYVNQSFSQYSDYEWDNGIRPRDNRYHYAFEGGSDFAITITPGSMSILLNPGDPTTITTSSLTYNSVTGFEVYMYRNTDDGEVGIYELEVEYYTNASDTTPVEVQYINGDGTGADAFAYFGASKTVSGTVKKIVVRGTLVMYTDDVPFASADVLKAMVAFYGN